jgi:hypothetical protein
MFHRHAVCWLGSLLCLLGAAEEPPATKNWFPPPTIAALVGLLEKWDGPAPAATMVLVDQPNSRLLRHLVWIDATKVLAKTTAAAKKGDEIAIESIASLEYARFGHATLGRIDQAMKRHDYEAALALIAELQKQGKHIHLEQQRLIATQGKSVVDGLRNAVAVAASGDDPDQLPLRLAELIEAVDATALPADLATAITDGWNNLVGRMTDAQRATWQDRGRQVRLTLTWDTQAPAYLAAAQAAATAKDWAAASAGFAKAAAAHAAFTEDDYVAYGTALVETGKATAATGVFWRMREETRRRPELRELFVRAGMMAPPFKPELLVLTWVGGTDDQAFTEATFAADGTITARGTSGLAVNYSADGTRLLGVTGDRNAPGEAKILRNCAVQRTTKNPFDGTEWQYGYKQVHSILQQPYVISPHGWHWWKWWYSICHDHPQSLMADSRCIELWFPNPTHFLVWVWSDGGNSSLDRDPRDLGKENLATKGQYFGGGTKIMRGVQKTGEPLNGWNFPGRPAEVVMDAYGNLYTAGLPRSNVKEKLFRAGGAGVCVFNPDLGIETAMCFGEVRLLSLAVRGNLLAVVGQVGRKASTDKEGKPVPAVDPRACIQVHNPVQPEPGGDGDAFLALVRLWPQGGVPKVE